MHLKTPSQKEGTKMLESTLGQFVELKHLAVKMNLYLNKIQMIKLLFKRSFDLRPSG